MRSVVKSVRLFDDDFFAFVEKHNSKSSQLDICEVLTAALQDYNDYLDVAKYRRHLLRHFKYKDSLATALKCDKHISAILDEQNHVRGLPVPPRTPISDIEPEGELVANSEAGSAARERVGSQTSNDSHAEILEREIEEYIRECRSSFWKKIIDYQMSWNALRLTVLRADRDIRAVLLGPAKPIGDAIAKGNTAFSLFGTAFYVPRTLRHLTIGVKHLFRDCSTDYIKRHSFTIMNDAVWAATGAITLGISTKWYLASWASVLGPGGAYLTVALYGFDVLNACWKWHQEVSKTKKAICMLDGYKVELEGRRSELELKKTSLENLLSNPDNTIEQLATLKADIDLRKQEIVAIDNKLTMIDDKKRELACHKEYVAAECKERLKIAGGMMVGMLLAVAGPVGLIVGSSMVLAMCYYQYRSKTVIMPRKAVECSVNAPLMLQRRLQSFVMQQILHLNKHEKKGSQFDQARTKAKLEEYKTLKQELLKLCIDHRSDKSANTQLADIVETIRLVSLQGRYDNRVPKSFKQFKTLIQPYAETPWKNTPAELQEDIAHPGKLREALSKVLNKRQHNKTGVVVKGGIFSTSPAENVYRIRQREQQQQRLMRRAMGARF